MKGKVIIITGGSAGIGFGLAKKFVKGGSKVVINGRNPQKLAEAKKELDQLGTDVLTVGADVSTREGANEIVSKAVEAFGGVDVLINNAGISMRSLFKDVDLDVFEQVMNINFFGTLYVTKYALPYLLKSEGSVIGISSIAGKKGLPARTAYSASKFAMEGFLQSLRLETRNDNLHVLVVSPGFIATDIRKSAVTADGKSQGESPKDESKLMTPEQLAEEVYTATVKRKRDLVLTSQGKMLVKVDKFAPKFADKQVFNHFANEPDSPLKKK